MIHLIYILLPPMQELPQLLLSSPYWYLYWVSSSYLYIPLTYVSYVALALAPVLSPQQCHCLLYHSMGLEGSVGSLSNHSGFGFRLLVLPLAVKVEDLPL